LGSRCGRCDELPSSSRASAAGYRSTRPAFRALCGDRCGRTVRLGPSDCELADKKGALVGDRLAAMNKDWFSARLRTVCFIEGEGAVDTELCVHVFRAQDRETAFRRAAR
jgi:hypothetical protein